MNLDLTRWDKFEYDRIFKIKKGFYNKKPEESGAGKIPFLGAVDNNNGVTAKYTEDEIRDASKTGKEPNQELSKKIFPAHAVCVTNNGSAGYAYYQDKPFTCSHDVNPLYPKNNEFNKYTGLFIATIIMYDRYRWGYGRKWRPMRMAKSTILLPIKYQGNQPLVDKVNNYNDNGHVPDWDYMEKFMKEFNWNIFKTKNLLKNTPKLNTTTWKTFFLHDVVETLSGNGIDANKVTTDDPQYNYVSRNSNNNGVVNYIDKIEGKKPFPAGAMTLALGGSYLGCCFIQNKPFYTAEHMGVLIPKENISRPAKIFLATIIRNECKIKYRAFGRELDTHFRKEFSIKLPIKREKDGTPILDDTKKYSKSGYVPDWKAMENYIKLLPYGDGI